MIHNEETVSYGMQANHEEKMDHSSRVLWQIIQDEPVATANVVSVAH